MKETLESQMADHEQRLQLDKDRLESLRADHRAKENGLADGAERIKKAKSRLLDVKTNKEYEATLKEIDSITDANGLIEEEIIALLDEIDRTVGQVAEAETSVQEHRRCFEQEAARVDEELGSIDARLEKMLMEQEALRSRIDANVIRKFDLIRGRRNGRAVVAVHHEVCGGCHMNIPPQMYNDLIRARELILCPHCNRIIYCDDLLSEA